MNRVDGTLPSSSRLEACGGDPRVLAVAMSTPEGVAALDKAAGLVKLEKLPSERRLEVCDDDPRVLAALMAMPDKAHAVDKAAGLAK